MPDQEQIDRAREFLTKRKLVRLISSELLADFVASEVDLCRKEIAAELRAINKGDDASNKVLLARYIEKLEAKGQPDGGGQREGVNDRGEIMAIVLTARR